MICITPTVADTENVLLFDELPTSNFRQGAARVSRSATLDGGSVIDHQGTSPGDRTVTIKADLTETETDTLWYMFNNYTDLNISMSDGFFSCVISELNVDKNPVTITILIEEELS